MNKRLLILLGIWLGIGTGLMAQSSGNSSDYSPYPDRSFATEHTVLNVELLPDEPLIKGIVRYDLRALRSGYLSVLLNTSDIAIQSVMMNGNENEFRVSGDSLIIPLADSLQRGDMVSTYITFQSSSNVGINKDHLGNVWTSFNPGALHHWLPVLDNPVNSSTFEAYITIPADLEVLTNGRLIEDEIISADKKKVHWRSEEVIPLNQVFLAAGAHRVKKALTGVKRVRLHMGSNFGNEATETQLLNRIVNAVEEAEESFSVEFPYDFLNVLVLEDHYWEEQSYGAGVIVLYEGVGDLHTQVKRAVFSQYIGSYRRWFSIDSDMEKFEFLKSIIVNDGSSLSENTGLQSVSYWNLYLRAQVSDQQEQVFRIIQESMPAMISDDNALLSWGDLAALWYDKSGVYWNTLPEMEFAAVQEQEYVSVPATEVPKEGYTLEYIYQEQEGKLILVFDSPSGGTEQLTDLELIQYGFSDTLRSEILITGSEDSVITDAIPGLEYAVIEQGSSELPIDETKPFGFLINQLRSVNQELRIEAAESLGSYTDNPDLQLALNDALAFESDPDVKSAILSTLNRITRGDTGTEQTFIEELNSDSPDIRLSAAEALGFYPGNERVQYELQNVLLQPTSDTLFTTVLNSYIKVSEQADLSRLARNVQRSDSSGIRTLMIIEKGIANDSTNNLARLAMNYMDSEHPYELRKKALSVVLSHGERVEGLSELLERLLGDYDPRVRNEAVKILHMLGEEEILRSYSAEEYDPRILKTLRNLGYVNDQS